MSVFGNDALAFVARTQFLTIDGSSDTVTLKKDTQAVSLYSDVAVWVAWGKAPVAAAPGAEKTTVENQFYLPATTLVSIPVPYGTDSAPMKIAGIQVSGGGTLYVTERQV